ncbi:MAG: hypothetical protein ABIZ52_01805 [Candidatus Limnocylindrales bacterium]
MDTGSFDGTELDFWLGTWEGTWADGGRGTNTITRKLRDRVVLEQFEESVESGGEGALHGRSWSVFNADHGAWRQTWVDDHGAYLDFTGERVDGLFAFARSAPELGPDVLQRMVFRDVEPDGFRWTWEASLDGGTTWAVNWEIAYRRA